MYVLSYRNSVVEIGIWQALHWGTASMACGTEPNTDGINIPLVDLAVQHEAVAEDVAAGLADVYRTTTFVGGPAVKDFECEFASFVGVEHCIGVGNGTDAIEMALRAIGLERGDEVILPANTFVATAEAVARCGGHPLFVDVDDEHLLIDPEAVKATLTARTRAIIPVHLFGQVAPMERLGPIATEADAVIVEDAAQAHGARRNGISAGGLALAAATSFYPGKNLGAYGDAGAVLTNDGEVARRVRLLGNHGSPVRYEHSDLGFNSRLDAVQAVVLRAKLRRLANWNSQRRVLAARYEELLDGVDEVRLPTAMPGNEHVWHLYVVRVPQRDRVLGRLSERGIQAGVHYPTPIHLQRAFAFLEHCRGSFPVAETAADEILSLPLYPGMTTTQQKRVAEELVKAVRP